MNDEQIIDLYWSRDESAITESEKQYGSYVRKIAGNILRSAPDEEECVNDTWLRSWNAIPPQRPHVLRLFFAKITRNLSLDRYRHIHAEKRGSGEVNLALEELAESVPGASDVETELTAKELGRSISIFLKNVSERDRNIFVRRYFYLESAAEIAGHFGISEKHVPVILSRTRKKLKKYLEKEGYAL